MICEKSGRHVNLGLPRLVRVRCFSTLVVTLWGYQSKRSPLHTLTPSHIISHCFLVFFLEPKREREKRDFLCLESVASPSLSSRGRTRFDPFQGHTGAPAEPREPGGEAQDRSRARGPRAPTPAEGYVVSFVSFYKRGFDVPSH
jgi:hypothetical protein